MNITLDREHSRCAVECCEDVAVGAWQTTLPVYWAIRCLKHRHRSPMGYTMRLQVPGATWRDGPPWVRWMRAGQFE